jgi:hypothetical protein
MKTLWGKLERVRLGPRRYLPPKTAPPVSEVTEWCEEFLRDQFFFSPGYEVYYFRDVRDAVHFKLRWYDDLKV